MPMHAQIDCRRLGATGPAGSRPHLSPAWLRNGQIEQRPTGDGTDPPTVERAAIIEPMRVSASEALRFFLELAGILALGYWGLHVASTMPLQALLTIGAPVALILVWALFIAPRAVFPMSRLAQAIAGGLLLEIAAVSLVISGMPVLGLAYGALVAIDTAALALAEVAR
jgi:hypothetical protein